MKKLYILLVILFIGFGCNSQIVNISDANFKAKLLQASPTNQVASTETPDPNGYVTTYAKIDTNNDGEIQVSEALALKWLNVSQSNISNLTGIESFTNLQFLNCHANQLININVIGLTNLQTLYCSYNQLTSLNVSSLTNLKSLEFSLNQLTSIDLSSLTNLQILQCSFNQLTSLDVSSLSNLLYLYCNNNQFITLFLKNGRNEDFVFYNNPTLQYICADEGQLASIQNQIANSGYNCHVNSYCSFSPGGMFYNIQGSSYYDYNTNGCDTSDIIYPNLKFAITDGIASGTFISDNAGSYNFPVAGGNHTVTPILENPSYYNVLPVSTTITFPGASNPFLQNYCITPNGQHQDVETWITPLTIARPGFNSRYKIKFKNKGNFTVSGSLDFSFDEDHMDFILAAPAEASQNIGLLSWNYTGLAPFETREIEVEFNLNTPMESLPLNIGDLIKFQSTIYPLSGDEYQTDNSNFLRQIVVGSYDPNDITCIERPTIDPEMVGKYVHYVIRFENTGTANAENIVVKDEIDPTKFDMNTLIPLSGSAFFITRITNTNQVEFIFENINLPFDDAGNDGYLVFKIKTKPTLVVGDTFSNNANIYFDYNFPIVTNTANTAIQLLGTQDFDFNTMFSLSPVPAKNVLNIAAKETLAISSINIYNALGQLVQANTNPNEAIDVSGLKTGSYFIKIISDKGMASSKFIKE